MRYRSVPFWSGVWVLGSLVSAGVSAVAQQPSSPMSQALPEIALPQIPDANPVAVSSGPGASVPVSTKKDALPKTNEVETQTVVETRKPGNGQKYFSFGESGLSILFLPSQVKQMREAIIEYESVKREEKPVFEETKPLEAAKVEDKVPEPDKYPVFFLTSIAYKTPLDWSIWIGGHKITSRKNESDVKVLAVTPEAATLAWRADYTEAIKRRKLAKLFVETDQLKHKLAVVQRVGFDPMTGLITFTLRPNQSFSVGHFSVFEGYVDNPQMPPMTAGAAPPGNLVLDSPPVNPPPSPPEATVPGVPSDSGGVPGQMPDQGGGALPPPPPPAP